MVATDRISAHDLVLPSEIPAKGRILTAISLFWFSRTGGLVKNHFVSAKIKDFPDVGLSPEYLQGRAMLVKKAQVIPVECIVRGYIAGSAWKEYQDSGTISGLAQSQGLVESDQLAEPIFTPSTKATEGHDENISIEQMEELLGHDLSAKLILASLNLYSFAASFARSRGVIIADTKFEFGVIDGEVILIDEVLTPDSSRFWPLSEYEPGGGQPSFDKQYVRDWLDESGWDRQAPAPILPEAVVKQTSAKYIEAYEKLTGVKWIGSA